MTVAEILKKVKENISIGNYDIVTTAKNKASRRKYGLTQYDLEDYILSLAATDLYKGPEKDRDYPQEELFIFKKEIIPNVTFYTKLKYKNNQIKILSCHEDEN
ncbi:MAG TPA: hypothetical protein DHU33_03405 [Firmicutes bacterium]|nr:hypothetical protein [Bacillota bacterium]